MRELVCSLLKLLCDHCMAREQNKTYRLWMLESPINEEHICMLDVGRIISSPVSINRVTLYQIFKKDMIMYWRSEDCCF